MKKTILIIMTIFTMLLTVTSAFADVIGSYKVVNHRGLVKVKSIEGHKMAVDIVYASQKGKVIILTGVFADYDSQTRKAV